MLRTDVFNDQRAAMHRVVDSLLDQAAVKGEVTSMTIREIRQNVAEIGQPRHYVRRVVAHAVVRVHIMADAEIK